MLLKRNHNKGGEYIFNQKLIKIRFHLFFLNDTPNILSPLITHPFSPPLHLPQFKHFYHIEIFCFTEYKVQVNGTSKLPHNKRSSGTSPFILLWGCKRFKFK